MLKINIDNIDIKKIPYLVLYYYKNKWVKTILFYSLEQKLSTIEYVVNDVFPILYKLRNNINIKFLGIPICSIKNDDHKIFFIDYYKWNTIPVLFKNNLECVKCSEYRSCQWFFWKDIIKLSSLEKKSKNIKFSLYESNLKLLELYLKNEVWLTNFKILQKNWNLWLLSESDIINFDIFSSISIAVTKDDYHLFKNTDYNFLLKNDNYWHIKNIKKKFWFNVDFHENNIYDFYDRQDNEYYIYEINELLDNIYIPNNFNIENNSKWVWIWDFIWNLKFINIKEIKDIKSNYEDYVIFIDDSINLYIPEIYNFKYFIMNTFKPLTHCSIIIREISWEVIHSVPYDFLLNLNTGDTLNINYKSWKIIKT